MNNPLVIAAKSYQSRQLVGLGKYKDLTETRAAIDTSDAEIVTMAIRRAKIGQHANEPSLLEFFPRKAFTFLPNTTVCNNAQNALRSVRLTEELLDGHKLVKLEVQAAPKILCSASANAPATGMTH